MIPRTMLARAARALLAAALLAGAGSRAHAGDPPPGAPPAPRPAAPQPPEPRRLGLPFDRYYDNAALEAALRRIAATWPDLARLESMGTSREGRPLWVMTVGDPAGGPLDARPAMYVDANTHGNEVQGGEVCLFTLQYLLERRATDPFVAGLLRRVTFHVAPCVNPDARDRFLHGPSDEHSPRRVLRPVDDDRDGLVDEDGPDDLDGDGEILSMRRKDPNGEWVVDERDDRLMRRVKAGERGAYALLGAEGVDGDGDGRVNEDPVGGVDANRNWPCDWRPDAVQGGAGPFPLSEPETRATALWILAHPRIAGVQSYHNAGQMILRPPGSRTDAEASYPAEDKALYDELGRRGGLLLPGYRYLQIKEGLYQVYGGFLEWTAHALGVVSFTNELWGQHGWGTPTTGGDLGPLHWNDVALHGAGFVRWHEVIHPTLGPVELGGWKRFTMRSTPVDYLADLCMRNTLFTLEHAASLPDVAIRSASREDGGRRIRVVLENRALLPTATAWARRHRLLPPDVLGLDVPVLAAALVRPVGPADPQPVVAGTARLEGGVRGSGTITVDLFVDPAKAPTTVEFESRLGGHAKARVP